MQSTSHQFSAPGNAQEFTNSDSASSKNSFQDYVEMLAAAGILLILYFMLKPLRLFESGLGISSEMSYGFIFLIGLVAASSSCIAVTGGVLMAMSAQYNLHYQPKTSLEKMTPHLLFNAGRIISYTLLGGLLGVIGAYFKISGEVTGFITIFAAVFMILMGLKILKLFPGLHRFSLTMPKWIGHRVLKLESKKGKAVSFLMGAFTFFLPCGFTQALQLYAISRGSFVDGALTMLFFSLGTLPALLSLSAISSFAKGTFQRYFLKFAGVMVLVLGIMTIGNGFTLAGIKLPTIAFPDTSRSGASNANRNLPVAVPIVNGKQIVEMEVSGYEYLPSEFTVVAGVPVEWRIDGTKAAGCGQFLSMPAMRIQQFLPKNELALITFTPTKTGDIPFNCSMGMMTPGAAFHVIPNSVIPNPARS